MTPGHRLARGATLLAGAAAAGAAWGIGTAIGLARLGTGLAVRASAELAGYAGQALRGLAAELEADSRADSSHRDDAGSAPRRDHPADGASGPGARNAAGPGQDVEEESADGR
jgi:hypothetical protein